jgi:hypothetical protein
MDKKITGAFILGCIGDIIGFGNGINEFNSSNHFSFDNYGEKFKQAGADYSNELVFNFINDGGFNNHPKPEWIVSDDTFMTFANAEALVKWGIEDPNQYVIE